MTDMRLIILTLAIGVVLAVAAQGSVISAALTEQKCGNGIREGYELCEPDTAYDLCPSIGRVLKIAMVCHEQTCACLPDRTAKDCGNGIPEGVEMCENDKKGESWDFCPNISQIIGVPLKCDLESCDCVNDGRVVKISACGDDKVEGDEDCEEDEDCPKGRNCQNCTCVRPEEDLTNLTPVQYNVTTDDVPVPTIEDIIRQEKNILLNFVLNDYIGEVIPEELEYFDEEEINIYVAMKDGSNATVGVVTTEMVVQEVHQYELNDSTMDIWIDEDAVAQIKAADKRAQTILTMLETGTIRYKPTGLWRRLWFWFFTPF